MIELESLKWRFVTQLQSSVRVYVVHHQVNICLQQTVKAGAFGQNPANQFMVDFQRALLEGRVRVTIKNMGSAKAVQSFFQSYGI